MGVTLVSHIKKNGILLNIKNFVQSKSQFDAPEIGCQMSAVTTHLPDDLLPALCGDRLQLLHTH